MTLGSRTHPPEALGAPVEEADRTAPSSLALRASGAGDIMRRFAWRAAPAAALGGAGAALALDAAGLGWPALLGGAVAGALAAGVGLYTGMVVPRVHRLPRFTLSWGFHVLELRGDDGSRAPFDLRRPHRAFILRTLDRGRMLIRVEQPSVDPSGTAGAETLHRLDVIAPIPDRCRCSAQADLRGGRDLRRCLSTRPSQTGRAVAVAPLEVAGRGRAVLAAVDALLDLLEAHRDARTLSPRLELAKETVEVVDEGLSVSRGGETHVYRFDGLREVSCKGRHVGGHETRAFIALIPTGARVPPLVFSVNGPAALQSELSSEWERSELALDARAFHLDLATPESLLVAKALRRFFRGRDADHPVARLLDHA